jgi:hypothetical protein
MKKLTIAAMAICLLAGGWSGPAQSTMPQAQPGDSAREAEFDFNPEQFIVAFNAAAKSFGQSFRLHKVDVKHGSVHDYFQHTFSNGVSLTAGVSKETGRILSVTALIEANGRSGEHSHTLLLAIAEVVATATNPNLTKARASAMAADMLKEADSNQEAGQFPQRFIHHVRYVLRNSSGIGYWLIASPG